MSQTTRDFVPISEQYRLFITVPPLNEQQLIARSLRTVFSLAESLEGRLIVGTDKSEAITQAVLAKAFRGELVPTEADLARAKRRPCAPVCALPDRPITLALAQRRKAKARVSHD